MGALPLGELLEVVAGAERPSLAGDHDDVDVGIVVGLLDGLPDLSRHRRVDGVEPLGPVEGDAGLAPVGLVANAAHLRVTVTRAVKAPSLLSSPRSLIPRDSGPATVALKRSA